MSKAFAVLLVTGAFGSKGFGRSRPVKTSDSNTGFLVRSYSDPLPHRQVPTTPMFRWRAPWPVGPGGMHRPLPARIRSRAGWGRAGTRPIGTRSFPAGSHAGREPVPAQFKVLPDSRSNPVGLVCEFRTASGIQQ
ncbi:hypothetical protein EDD95_5242 [Streptomyces sp. CEV 2-1]|nr:hypothetical protein EDD95_5242 [Streptomyces sp. CEV 2-1]